MSAEEKEKKRRLCVKMGSNYQFEVCKTGLKMDLS